MKIFQLIPSTAPKVISEKVFKLSESGNTELLIQAINNERSAGSEGRGESTNGKVVIHRLGFYTHGRDK